MFDWVVSNAKVDSQVEAKNRCIEAFNFCTCNWIEIGWNPWFVTRGDFWVVSSLVLMKL